MSSMKKGLALGGAIISSAIAAACCIGPLVLVLLGLGGGWIALAMKPYRPYFLAMTILLLGAAYYLVYRKPVAECGPGENCTMPRSRRAGVVLLWIVTVLVVLLSTFPYYSVFIF